MENSIRIKKKLFKVTPLDDHIKYGSFFSHERLTLSKFAWITMFESSRKNNVLKLYQKIV